MSWLIEQGGGLLENIDAAIGGFVGGIVGGFMSGVTNQLLNIATALSSFMTNVQPFIAGAAQIDASSLNGIKTLADIILTLTAADILQGITLWITGGSSIASFGEELAAFSPSLKAYADSVSGIDAGSVTASVSAIDVLVKMAQQIPNTGGLASLFMGDNDISSFGTSLNFFDLSLRAYYDEISTIKPAILDAATKSLESLVNLGGNISGLDGLADFGLSLSTIGNESVDRFIAEFTGADKRALEAGKSLSSNLETGVKSGISNFQAVDRDAAQGAYWRHQKQAERGVQRGHGTWRKPTTA